MSVLDNIEITDTGKSVLTSILTNAGKLFMEHPFLSLLAIGLFILVMIILTKQSMDSSETKFQNFVFRIFISSMTILLTLAFLFAMDTGLLSLQMVSGWF